MANYMCIDSEQWVETITSDTAQLLFLNHVLMLFVEISFIVFICCIHIDIYGQHHIQKSGSMFVLG